jgi:hypothetical protein
MIKYYNVDAAIFKEQNCYRADMWRYNSSLPHEVKAWGLKQAIIWLKFK